MKIRQSKCAPSIFSFKNWEIKACQILPLEIFLRKKEKKKPESCFYRLKEKPEKLILVKTKEEKTKRETPSCSRASPKIYRPRRLLFAWGERDDTDDLTVTNHRNKHTWSC